MAEPAPATKPKVRPLAKTLAAKCFRCSDTGEIARDGVTFEELADGKGMIPCPNCAAEVSHAS
jgi:hypothetical protein